MSTKKPRKFYQEKEFVALKKEWDAKLEASGLEDIEHVDPETGRVSAYFSARPDRFRQTNEETAHRAFNAPFVADYYSRAERYAYEALGDGSPFWVQCARAMHSQGDGRRRIAKAVGKGTDLIDAVTRAMRGEILDESPSRDSRGNDE